MRSCVGDLPAYLLAVAWLPELITQLIMTIWSCVWARIRPEDLESSSLPALCQVFSSQVMSCQPHDPQKYIAVPMVLSLWLRGTRVPRAIYAPSTAYITVLRNRSFQSLLHTAKMISLHMILQGWKRQSSLVPVLMLLVMRAHTLHLQQPKWEIRKGVPWVWG